MFYSRSLLEIAEYIFITASVVGFLANYIFDKPIIYAVGCVLISLLINLVNRHKLAAQIKVIKFDNTGKIEQYQESISQMISQLQNSIALFESTAENLEDNQENIKIKPLLETIKSLSNRFDIQEQTIKLLQTELEMISQQFKQRPELQQINDLTSVIIDLQQFIKKLPEWSDLRQHQFQKLEEKVNHALHKLEESIAEGKRKTEVGRREKEEVDGDSNHNQL
ncbi:hypothetical protein [Okeania sp. SIO1I7]|uniref:hypothetical protein n=1 Tax=Okeania sp. SIO1I7 TaxID=2607772 RepID=UPI0013F79296|nr:hypothetical protein [Okeania sp. SIO1I7]NET29481.1 hypothetical protein [Okeania sp. SIO1I7]